MRATARTPIPERLAMKVEKTDSGCWEWTGKRYHGGYGHLIVRGRYLAAHRVAYETHVGPIPPGMFVCHHCDNPPCINPDHLFLGTPAQNSADMCAKRRGNQGEQHPRRKLGPDEVRRIRAEYAAGGRSQKNIAAEFGVCQTTVHAVVRGKTWPDEPGAVPIQRTGT